jgi:hypothetical protein
VSDKEGEVRSEDSARRAGIRYPVAQRHGELVWADRLADARDRVDDLTCIACGDAVRLRAGASRRPHFAHQPGVVCTGGETVLHATTMRVLAAEIAAAAAEGRPFVVALECDSCNALREGDLARDKNIRIDVDRVLSDRVRPDLTARAVDGTPRYVLEVVVTHPPEPEVLALYKRLDLPTVMVWPSWEMLPSLRRGLHAPLRLGTDSRAGGFAVLDRCRFPRHRAATPAPCVSCGRETRQLNVEVATTRCWSRSCGRRVVFVDVYDPTTEPWTVVAAGARDLIGIEQVARDRGARLAMHYSKTVQRKYRMFICSCGAPLGDYFLYAAGEGEGEPTPGEAVWRMRVCAEGHWEHEGEGVWQRDAHFARVSGVTMGMFGESAGLFEARVEPESSQPMTTVRPLLAGDARWAARRMMGLDSW